MSNQSDTIPTRFRSCRRARSRFVGTTGEVPVAVGTCVLMREGALEHIHAVYASVAHCPTRTAWCVPARRHVLPLGFGRQPRLRPRGTPTRRPTTRARPDGRGDRRSPTPGLRAGASVRRTPVATIRHRPHLVSQRSLRGGPGDERPAVSFGHGHVTRRVDEPGEHRVRDHVIGARSKQFPPTLHVPGAPRRRGTPTTRAHPSRTCPPPPRRDSRAAHRFPMCSPHGVRPELGTQQASLTALPRDPGLPRSPGPETQTDRPRRRPCSTRWPSANSCRADRYSCTSSVASTWPSVQD